MLAIFGFHPIPVGSGNQDGYMRTRWQGLQAGSTLKWRGLQLTSRSLHLAFDIVPEPVNVLLQSFIRATRNDFFYLLLLAFLLELLRRQLLLATLLFLRRFGFLQLHGRKMVLNIFIFGAFD